MALYVIRIFSELEGFSYQKQFFGLFCILYIAAWDYFCIESITFIGYTLLATSFVVSVLKEKTKIALLFIRTFFKFWFWCLVPKTLLLTFLAACNMLHSIWVPVLKETTKKALWVMGTCSKLEGFCYQKQV